MAELISMTRKKAQMAMQKNAIESIVHVLSIAYKIAIMLKYYSGEYWGTEFSRVPRFFLLNQEFDLTFLFHFLSPIRI